MNKLEIAKQLINGIVAMQIASVGKDVVVANTSIEEDTRVVQMAEFGAGLVIATKTQKHTDRAVDFAIAKFDNFKTARAAK